MNWIKQNPLLSSLLGSALVLCAALAFFAMKGETKYQDAKSSFDEVYAAVQKSEKLELYPSVENRDAKKKALDDYSQSIDQLRDFYGKYQIDPSNQITTQKFTEHLKAAKLEVQNAFKASDIKLPADFFMGFEAYGDKLAKTGSTALLDYELNAIKHLLLGMAEARPSELIRIFREKIPEENDVAYVPFENDVSRKFSYELVFKGSEASVRDFITKLGQKKSHYCVIRSIRINNERKTPPKISDAKFEAPVVTPVDAGNPFGAGFFEEPKAPEVRQPAGQAKPEALPEGAQPPGVVAPGVVAPAPVAPVEAPKVAARDSSRILAQVLGDEELQVFVRFDILLFLPTKEITKP